MSEPTNKSLQHHFYSQFQASHTNLVTRMDACKSDATSHNDWQELALDIRKLRKSLTDATSFLPAYDQRQYQVQMDMLEQTLEEIRSASVSKTKFAFKRKTIKKTLSAGPTRSAIELPADASVTCTFPTISSRSHCRLSLQSIPTFGAGHPSSDLTISDLDHCIVDLCDTVETVPHQSQLSFTALHVRDLKETILILPNVKGSVLLHNLQRCTVFRMHNSIDVRVYLAAVSNPVIEKCSAIAFAEYPSFVSLRDPSINAGLPPNGKHADVQDFSHIRPTPSPNWSLLSLENENWDDLLTLDDSLPRGLDVILTRHLPEATSKYTA
ncbi:tubulin binding cofactor C-domain-containing protein [Russula earlei]|uniref:Tubulin binding cofactor C-domain-containing protein n=1 Tax=Russula earlei TaxID=71964 RepID=A0ACC0UQ35_9AGAM|nr:tubulin binding cofactor C-domain-containing protein [Russula earlei]